MARGSRPPILTRQGGATAVIVLAAVLLLVRPTFANGGTIRVGNQLVGPYEVTVFTSPSPMEVGTVDVSVAVQRAGSSEMVLDAQVSVVVEPVGRQGRGGAFAATHEQATNKLLYAANVDLPTAGLWRFTVEVESALGEGKVAFEAEVAEPSPLSNPSLLLPLAPILLLALWWLLRARRRAAAR